MPPTRPDRRIHFGRKDMKYLVTTRKPTSSNSETGDLSRGETSGSIPRIAQIEYYRYDSIVIRPPVPVKQRLSTLIPTTCLVAAFAAGFDIAGRSTTTLAKPLLTCQAKGGLFSPKHPLQKRNHNLPLNFRLKKEFNLQVQI